MDFAKKVPGFIYLDKGGFFLFEPGLGSVLSLAFSTTSVRDMDIMNRVSLHGQIQAFIEQFQLQPGEFVIILSPNITFEKEILDQNQENTKIEVDKFIDTVPFDSVLSKEYPISKGVKVIACNNDMYLELKSAFEKNASSINFVVPYQVLGQDQALINNLTVDSASELLKKVDRLKQFSMVTQEKKEPIMATGVKKDGTEPKKKNTKLIFMIAIFVVLFIILGIMIVNM